MNYIVLRDGREIEIGIRSHRGAVNRMRDAAFTVAAAASAQIEPGDNKDYLVIWDHYYDKKVAEFTVEKVGE